MNIEVVTMIDTIRSFHRDNELLKLALEWQRSSIIERQHLRSELEAIRFDEYRKAEKERQKKLNNRSKK